MTSLGTTLNLEKFLELEDSPLAAQITLTAFSEDGRCWMVYTDCPRTITCTVFLITHKDHTTTLALANCTRDNRYR